MNTSRILLILVILVALALLPLYGSDTIIQFGISTLLLAVLAQGWNIIGGYAGYPSFGNSAFYGLGAYGVGIAMVQWQMPFAMGLVFGVILAVVFAICLGIPVLRPAVTETTALGAAYLAGLATGVYRDLGELQAQWQVDRRFLPTLSRADAAARMARWEHAVRQTLAP